MRTINIFTLVGKILIEDNATKALAELEKKAKSTEGKLSALGSKVSKVGGGITKVGKGLTKAVSVPLLGIATASVKTGMDFEAGMSKVGAISQASGADMEKLSKKAREMGAATSFSATDAANGMEYMALAGWETTKIMDGIGPVLRLAEAGALDLGRASDLVTDSMSALGVETDDLDGYLDKVAKTAASSNTDIDALMEATIIAGGSFKRFNVPLEESNAFLGILANRGNKGSEAGTALNAIMTRLGQSTGPAADALEELGINAYDNEGNFRGLETVMKDVEGSFSKMTEKEQSHYTQQLAGLNHGKSFSAMLSGLGEEYDGLKGKISDSDGALQTMATTMKDNLAGRVDNMKSALEEVAIVMSETLIPMVEKVVEWISKAAEKFQALSPHTQKMVVIFGLIAAAIGPIILGIGAVVSIIGGMITGFATIGGILPVIGGLFGIVFGAITGPVLITIAAIAGLIAIFVALYKNSEVLRDIVAHTFETIKRVIKGFADFAMSILSGVWDFIKDLFGVLKSLVTGDFTGFVEGLKKLFSNLFTNLLDIARTGWELFLGLANLVMDALILVLTTALLGIWNTFKVLLEGIANIFKWAWEKIKTQAAIDFAQIGEGMKVAWEGIKTFFSALWDGIKLIFSTAWQNIKDSFNRDITQISTFITTSWEGIKNFFSSLWIAIKIIFSTAWGYILAVVTQYINNLKNSITNIFNAIKFVITSILNGIKTFISFVWNTIVSLVTNYINNLKNNISIVFNAIKSVVTTIFNGIKSVASSVWSAIVSLVTNYINNLKSNVSTVFNAMKTVVSTIFNAIKSVATTIFNGIKTAITNSVNNIKDTVTRVFNGVKDAIINPVETAKNVVGGIVDKIKGFFSNMKLKIPEIKMPSMPKLKMPSFGGGKEESVKWNARGGIFSKPTIFNTDQGLQGVGEAGQEAIMPISQLRTWIGEWMNVDDKPSRTMINSLGSIIKEATDAPTNQGGDYNVTFNITGDWVVDNDERQRSVVEELSEEMKKFNRSRGVK